MELKEELLFEIIYLLDAILVFNLVQILGPSNIRDSESHSNCIVGYIELCSLSIYRAVFLESSYNG